MPPRPPRPGTRAARWQAIIRLAAREEPELRAAILTAYSLLADLTTERALIDALAAGDQEGAIRLLLSDKKLDAAYARFRGVVRRQAGF